MVCVHVSPDLPIYPSLHLSPGTISLFSISMPISNTDCLSMHLLMGIPGEENGNPLQYSCHGQRSLAGPSP